jgi:hypothetical protein
VKKPLILLFILLVTLSFRGQSQATVKDSSIAFSIIGVTGAYQLPGGDLANRFGNDVSVGANFQRKLKSNWIFGIEGDFFFGDQVKETQIFDSIVASNGYLITEEGHFSDILLTERGFKFELKAGKIFPFIGPNPNSGLLIQGGVGLLQHKIRIETPGGSVPSVSGDYAKGYDRLSNGASLTEFAGYINFANKRLVNFYLGVEATQAFTQNRRSYNFDMMKQDNAHRLDLFFGIRAGWMFPLYKRLPAAYYYN